MKTFLRNVLAGLLGALARLVVKKYKPKIVMVTGSVGKTSTKDAVAAALSSRTYVRASEKSYNSEFGVPLTIFGTKNPWNNLYGWIRVVEEALVLLMFPSHYPKMLVLEVGADRPGDLARILKIATPDAVVVTKLPDIPVHVEAYASPEAVREEEFAPAYALTSSGSLIVSADDAHAVKMAKDVSATLVTYGFSNDAQVKISGGTARYHKGRLSGMEAEITVEGKEYNLIAEGALGRQQLFAPAAAVALMLSQKYSVNDALTGLENYVPPPGRGRIFSGINSSLLIDDSYNASPAAVEESLRALCLVEAKRRIAVLGDMLELGRYSTDEHERIGTFAASCVDILVAVGIRARSIADAAKNAALPEAHVFSFDTAEEAAHSLTQMIEPGDIVLIKGSQIVRTERIVKKLLAHSEDVEKLVRQEKEWENR